MTDSEKGAPPEPRTVEIPGRAPITLGLLSALDTLRFKEKFGHPIEAFVDVADEKGNVEVLLWIAWRSAVAGETEGCESFEDFAGSIPFTTDGLRTLLEETVDFFVELLVPGTSSDSSESE